MEERSCRRKWCSCGSGSPDSEKITINLGYVDLGRIDLLVQEGFFSNRTDFIRTAIRNQLNSQSAEVSRRRGDTPS